MVWDDVKNVNGKKCVKKCGGSTRDVYGVFPTGHDDDCVGD